MATSAAIVLSAICNDGTRDTQALYSAPTIADVLGTNGKREDVALTAAFTALSPPTGAVCVMIKLVSGAVTLTLKGVTGDTGIKLQSGTLSTIPICLPLGTTPSIGILSDGVGVVEVLWL